jgi:hypothetical protein
MGERGMRNVSGVYHELNAQAGQGWLRETTLRKRINMLCTRRIMVLANGVGTGSDWDFRC